MIGLVSIEVLNENAAQPLSEKQKCNQSWHHRSPPTLLRFALTPAFWAVLTQQAEIKACSKKKAGYSKLKLIHPENRKTSFSNKIGLLNVCSNRLHQVAA